MFKKALAAGIEFANGESSLLNFRDDEMLSEMEKSIYENKEFLAKRKSEKESRFDRFLNIMREDDSEEWEKGLCGEYMTRCEYEGIEVPFKWKNWLKNRKWHLFEIDGEFVLRIYPWSVPHRNITKETDWEDYLTFHELALAPFAHQDVLLQGKETFLEMRALTKRK